jgi:hypothetical protein
MKKKTTATAVLSHAKKWPARLADSELSHLEAVLAIAGRRSVATAVRGLDLAYWSTRLDSVETQYDLLASQIKRVAALSCSLAALEPTVKTVTEHGTPTARIAA